MYKIHRDNEWLDQPATRREGRNALKMVAISSLVAFVLLGFGAVWSTNIIVNNTKNDIIDNAVSICERGIPVRKSTNAQALALEKVARNTAAFLEGVASYRTTTAKDRQVILSLVDDYKEVADSTFQVPIIDCNTEYRESLHADK